MARYREIRLPLGALAVLAAGAYYWLFLENPKLAGVDIAQVRWLGSSASGELPVDIRLEHVMDFKSPNAATLTGDSWKETTLWGMAFQLVYKDHTAILETIMNAGQAKASAMVTGYYNDA